ncbi:sulfatase-like hydrolase/transferase [Planctomycetota bacterium]
MYLLIVLIIIYLPFNANAQVSFGESQLLNEDWSFTLANPAHAHEFAFNHQKWRKLDLPHDWSIEGNLSPTLSSCTGYLPGGIGWYRKTLDLSNLQADQKAYLYFEGVYNRSEVYINGQLVGKRPNGYISFMYDITPVIERSANNVVAVKVDHSLTADSRWYTGSGIYRDVYLITSGKVHFDQWGVSYTTPEVHAKKATVQVNMDVKNETVQAQKLKLVNVLVDVDGQEKASIEQTIQVPPNSTVSQTADLKVKDPNVWDLDNAYLYRLESRIEKNGALVDQTVTNVGIRTIEFDASEGFKLNGQATKIKGVCIHHDAGCLGSAVPKEVWRRRFMQLKKLGCNGIRMSHNPQAPDVYDLCDELGLLVMDEAFDEWEFPKRKWLVGWNKGKPGYEGSYDFFKAWSSRDVADMVRRDRNHPSIIMWSIGNEVDYPNDPYSHPVLDGGRISQKVYGGYLPDSPQADRLGAIAKRLSNEVRKFDKSRPVTAALAGVIMSNETDYPACLDIVGYNYTENRYELDHKQYPERIIYGSENGHNMNSWNAMKDRDFISAQFLWTGIDYLGESGAWPARGGNGGLLNYAGYVKPRGQFRRALWSEAPVAYVGTTHQKGRIRNLIRQAWPVWNYDEGQVVKILAFTNSPKAKLMLNGKQVGLLKEYDDSTGVYYWETPFEPGKLEVVGLNGTGDTVSSSVIQTSKRPHAIIAKADKKEISSNKGLVQIELNIVDENGIPVLLAGNEITCDITGPGTLLGLEAGNVRDMGNYNDNVQRVHMGKLIAYVQAAGEKGNIKVEFSSPWLVSSELEIKIQAIDTRPKKPNIIYILADDLGYGDLSCYGQTKFETPNIDRLARAGIRFTDHYSGSTVCAPSRGSLMTGKHTGHAYSRGNKGVPGKKGDFPLKASAVTVAEILKKAGYVTSMFGKWGLGYAGSEGAPNKQGFDEFYGYLHQGLAHHYYPYFLWHNREKIMLEGNAGKKQNQYAPELIHAKALEFLEDNKDGSFFMYYPSIIPHAELFAPQEYMEKYRGKLLPEKEYQGKDDGERYRKGAYGSQTECHAAFAAMVNLLDDQVGDIIDKVTELGIAENTIIIFSSDNGPHAEGGADPDYFNSGGGLRGIKRDLYEGGVRVPMIVTWPGTIAAGRETDHLSAFWDILPTLADLTNQDVPLGIDGISFLPELLGNQQKSHSHLYWEFYEQGGKQAVRKGNWKAVRLKLHNDYSAAPLELYNLEQDIAETNNLADQYPEVAEQMLKLMKASHSPSEHFKFKSE